MESTKALGPERRAPAVWGPANRKGSRDCDPGGRNDPETRHGLKEGATQPIRSRPGLALRLCWFSDTVEDER
jgi:hypothetical protein